MFVTTTRRLGRPVQWLAVLTVILLGSIASTAHAHKASDSYLKINAGQGGELAVRWDIAIKDLELLTGVDQNQDGNVTWGELKSKQSEITGDTLSHLEIVADGNVCQLSVAELKFTRHSDGGYAVLILNTGVSGNVETLEIQYDLLFDLDPTHRGLVLIETGDTSDTHVLSPSQSFVKIEVGNVSLLGNLARYTWEGVWHIWIGFDHILFLVTLLLPAVLIRNDDHQADGFWRPVDRFRPALYSVLKIVTVFTLAHSITLWLAVMKYVTLPGQFIESVIAASIIVTAVYNLYPIFKMHGWAIAFVFGLIHGFGFANVLVDLGLSTGSTLAVSLFGFNLGVELGQAAIVAVVVPIAFLIRKTWFYENVILKFGSFAITVIAAIWLVERVFNLEILGF